MANNLTGAASLAYQGTNAASPPNITVHYNRPTANFYQGFSIGDLWVYRPVQTTNNNELWVLMGVAGNVANWVLLSNGTGALLGLTGNSGGFVGPLLGNINVIGSSGILVAGNPGTHTLTISPSGGAIVSTLTGNSGGAISPLAGNINVVGDAVTINIVGNPGTHTLTASAVGTGLIQSLTTDDTHIVTPTAGTIIVHGGTGIATTGTVGPNTVTIATTGAVATSYVTDSGTAVPSGNVLDVNGDSHNIATSGSGHQVKVGLTGITQYSVQVGGAANALTQITNGTTGQVLTATTGANPSWQASSGFSSNAFYATSSVQQLNATGNSNEATVICGTVVTDTGSNYNAGSGAYTCPVNGVYLFGANAALSGANTGTFNTGGGVGFRQNGSLVLYTDLSNFSNQASTAAAYGNAINVSNMVVASAGDVITFVVLVNGSSSTVSISGIGFKSDFWGYLVQQTP